MAISYTLLAAMIGRRFNVTCQTSGDAAYTARDNGRYIINLPVISDESLQPVLTGYAYHEIAHVRHTQFDALDPLQDQMLRQLVNIFEDVRVERRIMKDYPGMLTELKAVEKYVFSDIVEEYDGCVGKLRYLLHRVRGLVAPSAVPPLVDLEDFVSRATATNSTQDCVALAQEAYQLIKEQEQDAQATKAPKNSSSADGDDVDVPVCDIGGLLEDKITHESSIYADVQASVFPENTDKVSDELAPMPPAYAHKARACASLMTNRLLALMQSYSMAQETSQLKGRVNTRALYKLAVNDSRVFARRIVKRTINAHVMVLLDGSGSMDGDKAAYASMAGYAFKLALQQIQGVTYEGYAFFNLAVIPMTYGREFLHNPVGVTPLGAAYDSLLCKTKPDRKNIIICITDGQIDDPDRFASALQIADSLGNIVTYGIGIYTNPPAALPADRKITISNISELPGKLFNLAQEIIA